MNTQTNHMGDNHPQTLSEQLRQAFDDLGEGIHTSLRKVADSRQSIVAWNAIAAMPPDDWARAVDWVRLIILERILAIVEKMVLVALNAPESDEELAKAWTHRLVYGEEQDD